MFLRSSFQDVSMISQKRNMYTAGGGAFPIQRGEKCSLFLVPDSTTKMMSEYRLLSDMESASCDAYVHV
jgi:hypothetical protein